jgi:hypothetical protein
LKRLWLFMCVVGTVLPYAVFIPWALKNGLDMHLLLDQARPPIAAFAWLDVVVAATVVLVLAIKPNRCRSEPVLVRCHRNIWRRRVLGLAAPSLLRTQIRTAH